MSYVDFLKQDEKFALDKYILLLLSIGMTVDEVSKVLKTSRQSVYTCIKRNQETVDKFKINQ